MTFSGTVVPMKHNPGVEDRMWLWENNAAQVTKAWREQGSDPDIVLVVADLNDSVGRALGVGIAQIQGNEQQINALILGTRGAIPTAYMLIDRQDLAVALSSNNPNISKRLRTAPPDGLVYVALIGSGGTTLLAAPV